MGCGVSTAANTQIVDVIGEPQDASGIIQPKTLGTNVELLVKKEVGETDSARSNTPRSLKSGNRSGSSSDDDEDEAQDDDDGEGSVKRQITPLRIRAPAASNKDTHPSPAMVDVKKGSIAFEVPLDESQDLILENVLKKPLPKRLRHLEPLGHVPQITTEMLMEKLERAEQKRQKALAKWKEQLARRREQALKRSEQMGDNNSTAQSGSTKDDPNIEDADYDLDNPYNFPVKALPESSSSAVPITAPSLIEDADRQQDPIDHSRSSPVDPNFIGGPNGEEIDDQNNNAPAAASAFATTAEDVMMFADEWAGFLSQTDGISANAMRSTGLRSRLQVVHEDEAENEPDSDESEDDFNQDLDNCTNIAHHEVYTDQTNNSCNISANLVNTKQPAYWVKVK